MATHHGVSQGIHTDLRLSKQARNPRPLTVHLMIGQGFLLNYLDGCLSHSNDPGWETLRTEPSLTLLLCRSLPTGESLLDVAKRGIVVVLPCLRGCFLLQSTALAEVCRLWNLAATVWCKWRSGCLQPSLSVYMPTCLPAIIGAIRHGSLSPDSILNPKI